MNKMKLNSYHVTLNLVFNFREILYLYLIPSLTLYENKLTFYVKNN